VFITECEFDNIDMDGTPVEWRHVSGVSTHRSVKSCLHLLNRQFWSCGSRRTAGVTDIVYRSAALKLDTQRMNKLWETRTTYN